MKLSRLFNYILKDNENHRPELGKWIMRSVLFITLFIITSGGCSYINKKLHLKDDNVAEQLLEAEIEEHTGLKIDLTPDSEED